MTASPELISGTTELRIPGNSRESGISSPPLPIPTQFLRASKTRLYFARPTVLRLGRSSPDFVNTAQAHPGSPVLVACVCTPSFLIRVTRNEYRLRFPLLAPSARTTPEKPGARLTGALSPKVFRIQRRSRPLRAPHRRSPFAPRRTLHAKTLGRYAQQQCRRFLAGSQRKP